MGGGLGGGGVWGGGLFRLSTESSISTVFLERKIHGPVYSSSTSSVLLLQKLQSHIPSLAIQFSSLQ